MVQGGDPTGTGKGGDSVRGKPLNDEFHPQNRVRTADRIYQSETLLFAHSTIAAELYQWPTADPIATNSSSSSHMHVNHI